MEVQGQERVEALTKAIAAEKKAIAELDAQLKAGKVSQTQFDAAARASAQNVVAHAAELKKVEKSLKDAGVASRDTGRGFLLLGQAVEDAQYGLAAIQNNAAQLIQAFGGSAGLAGAANLAAVAIARLGPQIAELVKSSFDAGQLKEFNNWLERTKQN